MNARDPRRPRFAARLLKWYAVHQRTLPWRGHSDPYAVWVSEIMLQQTRVEAVVPYFERWMARFPSIALLAAAAERDVLKAWEGLGYYSRARNLHGAARQVMQQCGGELPHEASELRGLPGIGRYTAGAIASIAFGRDEPALDGNIRRVLARVFNVTEPADSTVGQRRLWQLAADNLPAGRAGDHNQALMDLGATVCVPLNPRCSLCPLRGVCEARRLAVQNERPILKSKRAVPHHILAAAVIVRGRKVLLAQRPSRGLLGGMWEFPNARIGHVSPAGAMAAFKKHWQLDVDCREPLAVVQHGYSHFSVDVHAFRCGLPSGAKRKDWRWVPIEDLDSYPMGRIDRQIARRLA